MIIIDESEWIEVRKTNIGYYKDIDLFYKAPVGEMLLYKHAGLEYNEAYQLKHPYKGHLYITPKDKIKSLQIVQKGFSTNLKEKIRKKDTKDVKKELVSILGETLSQPRSGCLKVVPETVGIIVEGFSENPEIIKNIALMANIDYSTIMHSINVMALTINYCFYTHKSIVETRNLGMAALLHDVGKSEISEDILSSNRKLTDFEYQTIQSHTTLGEDILNGYGDTLAPAIPGAIEHHEKLDGSGYPNGIKNVSFCGMLLGIVDCYEAITNDERPYRSSMQPINALGVIKEEVRLGHYNNEIFTDFAYSLVHKDSYNIVA